MAKALGYATQQDAWSKQVDPWGRLGKTVRDGGRDIPTAGLDLAGQVEDFRRHLGIHSGGMVIWDRPVIDVCPVEWGRMADRSVLQWDRDDCAAVGLVKFDLLGLGMLSALHYAVDLIRTHRGYVVDLATIPQEDTEYDRLRRADSVGVSRTRAGPRWSPCPGSAGYDLVVEVALIRRARCQVLTGDGPAHLLAVEGGRWRREATND
jgi:error-prone DNA polymerase